jgi:hypothetical protein
MMTKRYEIGDKVWLARFDAHSPEHVTCPDCGGEGRIRAILHDNSIVSVECRNCRSGYEPPKGYVLIYRQKVRAEHVSIIGYEVDGDKIEYKTNGCYIHRADQVFQTEAEAIANGEKRQAAYQQEQKDKIFRKERPDHSWNWNVCYHRRQAEKAKNDLEYHTAKLNVAKIKAKDGKAT